MDSAILEVYVARCLKEGKDEGDILDALERDGVPPDILDEVSEFFLAVLEMDHHHID